MECMTGGELFDHIKDYEINGKLFTFDLSL